MFLSRPILQVRISLVVLCYNQCYWYLTVFTSFDWNRVSKHMQLWGNRLSWTTSRRKIGNRSSEVYSDINEVRRVQSLLYDLVDHHAIMVAETKLTQQDVDNKRVKRVRSEVSDPHLILYIYSIFHVSMWKRSDTYHIYVSDQFTYTSP